MELVNDHLAVKARLLPPNENGYLVLAGEVGGWHGPFPTGRRKRQAVTEQIKNLLRRMATRDDVVECTVFRASLRAPGEGGEVLDARNLRRARYDIVVLIRATNVADRATPKWPRACESRFRDGAPDG